MSGFLIGPSGVAPVVVVGSTTTLDPAFVNGSFAALSNGNLTVTCTSTGNNTARSVASHLTGLYYWEVTNAGAFADAIGICTAAQPNNTYVTADGKSAGVYAGSGWLGSGLSGTTTAPAVNVAITMGFALNATTKKIWVKDITNGGNWNANGTADPASGVNGCDFSASSDLGTAVLYVAVSVVNSTDAATVNFGATAYLGTPPSGFGNF